MHISTNRNMAIPAPSPALTPHARKRMHQRSLPEQAVTCALAYGRVVYTRGVRIHAIGKKEVDILYQKGIDIRDHEGVQVLCEPKAEVVMTVYRNRDFRTLRPRRRQHHWHA